MKYLLIDDDPISRTALLNLIGDHNDPETREAGTGVEALNELRGGYRPDLCLLDLQMPDMGGLELLQRMRNHPDYRSLRVVVTSATRDRKTIEALARLQVSGYLLKPFDPVKTQSLLQQLNTPAAAPRAVRKTARLSLLAIDDDPVVRTAITEHVLSTPDWDVQLAVDGEEAFELLYGGLRPDLIVTDLKMPNADGVSFIHRIRRDRNFADLRVAVISGHGNDDDHAELAPLNLFSSLKKPVNARQMDSLLASVRRVAG